MVVDERLTHQSRRGVPVKGWAELYLCAALPPPLFEIVSVAPLSAVCLVPEAWCQVCLMWRVREFTC